MTADDRPIRPRLPLVSLGLAGCVWISRGADPDGDGVPSVSDCAPSDPQVYDPTTFYRDEDDDGHGDPEATVDACTLPEGYAETADDCDDSDAQVHPDAEDLCGDGLDAACDGTPCSASLNDAYTTLFGDDGDSVGSSIFVAPDLTGDGQPDLVVGAEEHIASGGTAGKLSVISGGPIYSGTSPLDALAVFTAIGRVDSSVGSNLGHATAGGADLDQDGHQDLVVSAHRLGEGAALSGGVYLLTGPLGGGDGAEAVEDVADRRWIGTTSLERAGYGLALRELDDDGHVELAVGAYLWADENHDTLGAVYLIDDPMGDRGAEADLQDDDRLEGDADNDYFGGTVVTAGDFDADGLPDLAIAASGNDRIATGGGAVYLICGTPAHPATTDDASWMLAGTSDGASVGSALAAAGDVDGDGQDDLWIGARDASDGGSASGAVYLATSAWLHEDQVQLRRLDEATTALYGDAEDGLGTSLAANMDIDGDGFVDLAAGAMGRNEILGHAGAAYLLPGPPPEGTARMSDLARRYIGPDAYAFAGRHVALGRGLAGTDEVDLVVSSTDATVSNVESGAVYLLAGLDP